MKLELYLDLDGVFADFDKRVHQLTGKHPRDLERRHMWKAVNFDKRFFAELDVIAGSERLWEAVRSLAPAFLTGAPSSHVFREQKKEWVARIFGPEHTVHVVPRKDKQLFSGPHKVLVDDSPENIEQWVSKGGYGVLHAGDFVETVTALRDIISLYEGATA